MRNQTSLNINVNSMTGIGFLFLIFFFATTPIEANKAIQNHLLKKETTCQLLVFQKNTLEIIINNKNEILVNGVHIDDLNELKKITVAFIDNGAVIDTNGEKDTTPLDHSKTAIIKLLASREANYHVYIDVQNAITNAYTDLRKTVSLGRYNVNFTNLKLSFKKNQKDDKLESYINSIDS